MTKEKTLVYNGGSTTKVILNAFAGTKKGIDICASSAGPSIIAGSDSVKQASIKMAMRGVRIRFLTEITRENIPHCKEIMKVGEVRPAQDRLDRAREAARVHGADNRPIKGERDVCKAHPVG